jgi:hypothetical protein
MATDRATGPSLDEQMNAAGYVSVNPGLHTWLNQNKGTNFPSAEAYLQWVYGGGNTEQVNGQTWFKTPNGVENVVNQPLNYDPVDFTDRAWMLPLGIAGAGLLAGGLGGATGAAAGAGAAPSDAYWSMLAGEAPSGGIGTVAGGAADAGAGSWEALTSGMGAGVPGAETGGGLLGGVGNFPPGSTTLAQHALGSGGENIAQQQAIDAQAQSIYDANAAAGTAGYDPSLVSGVTGIGVNPGTVSNGLTGIGWLDRILGGAGTALANNWPGLLAAGVGAYGQNQMADAYREIADKYLAIGAPYRPLLQASYQPGFNMSNEPGYSDALSQATNAFLRSASAGNAPGVASGNPISNPGAWAETMKYVTQNTALPALYNYRSGLLNASNMGIQPSVAPAMAGVGAQGGMYDALGGGIASLFPSQNQQTQNDFIRALTTRLNTGGTGIV